MQNTSQIVIYGSSGHAGALASMLRRGLGPGTAREVVAFVDDFTGDHGKTLHGLPILSFEEWRRLYPDLPCLLSMGSPSTKAKIRPKVCDAGAAFVDLYRGRSAQLFDRVEIGVGSFIWEYCYIGTDTTIGEHTQIMPLCSVGHDVSIGDFCTICPSCVLSGYVVIEDGVFVGARTTIVNGTEDVPLRIGRGAKIWAGSVVTRSVEAGVSVTGNPAVPVKEFVQRRRSLAAA